jgi:CMP/dCMP kinase
VTGYRADDAPDNLGGFRGGAAISIGTEDMQEFDRRAGLVIAVDGPAGSGKSTAARRVAMALDLHYLDTGAMYRALTWWMLGHAVPVADPAAVLAHLGEQEITVGTDAHAPRIEVDGEDVAGPIRGREVSNAVSQVARIPQVRELLVARQQEIIADTLAAGAGIVAEGRDIGTVVAPQAEVKVYLTASERIRAERRSADLAADPAATVSATEREQALRDKRDAAQMAMAADAVKIDTTRLSLDEVVDQIIAMAWERAVRNG